MAQPVRGNEGVVGQVHATTVAAGTALAATTTYLYDQTDSNGHMYDRVIDPLGHHTDTYKDPLERSKAVYDDGTSTLTLHGLTSTAITG